MLQKGKNSEEIVINDFYNRMQKEFKEMEKIILLVFRKRRSFEI